MQRDWRRPPRYRLRVAIPLRGSIPCNGTPQRTPSWTAPPEGGL
ncbi:hypothetical protein [Thermus thermophilus HB8]|uniref:Uncharacterized protein n=1 Tax=Thermus thermophilus (strain ATCC 27634 / DSM 579 / HB8) TaxID=300852 RepID=Q5SJU4_THET8|nr:hypothetical protein [Thermus thermophilus HB8]